MRHLPSTSPAQNFAHTQALARHAGMGASWGRRQRQHLIERFLISQQIGADQLLAGLCQLHQVQL